MLWKRLASSQYAQVMGGLTRSTSWNKFCKKNGALYIEKENDSQVVEWLENMYKRIYIIL